jgi:hypothetical protein
MPLNAGYLILKCVYTVFALLFWPLTTLVATAYAVALKLPPLRLPSIRPFARAQTPTAPDS